MHPARLWKGNDDGSVQCRLCSHYCAIDPQGIGKCGVRTNREGSLYTLVFDKVAALNLDPVEKKPIYHFHPGTQSFSLGTMGCNLFCSFCQNDALSQTPKLGGRISGETVTPQQIVQAAKRYRAHSISYTYSEPTVFFELVQDTAVLAKQEGLKNILVSNGFMSPACLKELASTVDAINVDLKAFSERFYEELCGAQLRPVLNNLKAIRKLGWWLEVTTLIIPGWNDSMEELRELTRFIVAELGPEVPWHISRFHPANRMWDCPRTPVDTLEKAYTVGREAGLLYVYLGNVPGSRLENTFCPGCETQVIDRKGFYVSKQSLRGGRCNECGQRIAGVGLA